MTNPLENLRIPPKYDVEEILSKEFKRLKGHCYLDHAAAALYSDSQIQMVTSQLQQTLLGNPHSRSNVCDATTQIVDSVRQRILDHFNTSADEYDVIFTSGATQGLKIIAEHFNWNGSPEEKEDVSKVVQHRQNGHISETILQGVSYPKDEKEKNNQGAFVYAMENHTSVLGVRGAAATKGADVHCLETKELHKILDNYKASCKRNDSSFTSNSDTDVHNFTKQQKHCIFAYSAQCNFTGIKSPLEWIEKVQNGALNQVLARCPVNRSATSISGDISDDCIWYVLLDAAGFTATCPLDLSVYKPDFVPISFYKIFGYPTGLGCLLVSQRAWKSLQKDYYGGGSVLMIDSRKILTVPRPVLHDRFEDGTLPFLSILAVQHGFNTVKKLTGGLENVQEHVFNIARYTHHNLRSYKHGNGTPVVKCYPDDVNYNLKTHGSIVNFSLLKSDGSHIGYAQVEKFASVYNIHLRTGCLCNPGACQKYLNISEETLIQQFKAGHVCGDAHDMVEGCPTGSTRISFGYMSSYQDAEKFLQMVKECFVEGDLIIDYSWLGLPSNSVHNGLTENGNHIASDERGLMGKSSAFVGISPITKLMKPEPSHSEVVLASNRMHPPCPQKISTTSSLKLTDIMLYPVKSCSGIAVAEWTLTTEGLQYDRQWMIVTSSGTTMTQKRLPCMSLIKPNIDLLNGRLELTYQGEESISVPLEPQEYTLGNASLCRGLVCGDRINGHDCGPEVGAWLSHVLKRPDLKLFQKINERKKKHSANDSGFVYESLSLANESQYLVIHRASVRKLLMHISEKGLANLSEDDLVTRFRANLIVDGGEPYEEDTWEEMILNNLKFKIQGGCIRCQMVGIIPDTGERMKEPMVTLAATRGSYMTFGVHATLVASPSYENKDVTITTGSIINVTC